LPKLRFLSELPLLVYSSEIASRTQVSRKEWVQCGFFAS
jgi:hypothetical protein